MLSKEEYKRALENMHSQVDIETQWYSYDILKKLIDEHFGVKNEAELKNIYLNKPYKFEDLKPNMWVYDGIEKLICQIGLISKNAIHREYVDGTISDSPFEENRFFPVQCDNPES